MRKITGFITAVALVVLTAGSVSFAEVTPEEAKERALAKPKELAGQYQLLNINNLWTWIENNGESNHSQQGDNGVYYPRGSCWVIYKDGFKWGGMCYTDENFTQGAPFDQTIRMGGNDYGYGTVPGWIEGFGANARRVTPGEPGINNPTRIFRIRRDYYSMSAEELRRDAAEYFEQWGNPAAVSDDRIQDIYDQYEADWENWPVELGAPYIDRNGNGVYDPPPPFGENFTVDSLIAQNCDEPGLAGADPNSPADQVLWNAYNDLAVDVIMDLEGSYPMGLEIQRTVWGYKRTDMMGNIYFSKYKFINKGGVDIVGDGVTFGSFYIDSMYVAQWSDPDLGEYSEDLLGCDTLLSMGYVYNGNAIDAEYRAVNQVVPAAGYDFLQGPIVESPGGTAVFDLKYRDDYTNLPMTAFAWFSAGSPISDPESNYDGGREWYRMYQGWQPSFPAYKYYPLPPDAEKTHFPLSGDPVAGTGLLDGLGTDYSFPPGDRRMLLCSGPFQMVPEDTQEVVIGFVVGQGADRFSSISVMKFNDEFAQTTYDALFQVAKAPLTPAVTVAELDEKIVLDWGSALGQVKDIETKVVQPGTYEFEGYNVYQFPRSSSTLADAVRIKTFDLTADPTVILTRGFDQKSGMILDVPIQFGTNSGIERSIEVTRDWVKDTDKIFNGQEYYFAVTSYSHAKEEGFLPTSLESPAQVLTCVPKKAFGTELQTDYGDILDVVQTSGTSDGIVEPIVVDPTILTGDTYEIVFADTSGGVVANQWKLTNVTDNTVLLSDQYNFSGDGEYATIDGIFLKVSGPPLEGADWDYTGDRWFTGAGSGELLYGGAYLHPSWTGGTSGTAPPDFKTVEVRFVTMTGYTDANGNGEYDYGEIYQLPAEGTQKAFISEQRDEDSWEGFFDVPFTAWDVQDPANPRQLNVVIRDRDGNGQWDITGGDIDYNYVYIVDTDYDPTGQLHLPTGAGGPGFFGTDAGASQPILWVLWLGDRGRPCGPYGADVVLTLVPNFVITTSDVYRFVATAPMTDLDLQKASVEKISVFPNPYYAFNPAEVNRFDTFVTFAGLPPTHCEIMIFNLAGQMVRRLEKDGTAEFLRWELQNNDRVPVASGMYIAYVKVDLPAGGEGTKILKFAVIQEQEILNVY